MKPRWPLIGNEHIGELFFRLVASEAWPSATAFVGLPGLGKATAARWLVQADLCQAANRPCGQCPDCRQFLAGTHPHALVVEATDGEAIKIEAIRATLDHFAYIVPRRAWLVITDAQLLTEAAQNILLKFLEEPPANVAVIITLPSSAAVRPTVISRLAQFRWRRVTADELRRAFPAATAIDIAEADGRPGRLQRLLTDESRLHRRARASQTLQAPSLVLPPEIEESGDEAWYQAEEHVLRHWLYQSLGLVTVSDSPSPWPLPMVVRRLQAYLQRTEPSWQNVSPRTKYAHLHLV